jgi:Phosphorylase superfamily
MEADRLGASGCLPGRDYAIVCATGAAAFEAASGLAALGAAGLISVGFAGGLAPRLQAGAALLASEVVDADGARYACDAAWRAGLRAALGGEVSEGPLAGAASPLAAPAEKRALARGSGALAVDTESHHVARAAAEAGLRFVALRIVVDRLQDTVPRAALAAYGADGRIRPLVLAWQVLRWPADLPGLFRLGRQSRIALARLGGVGRLGAGLGPPV